MRIFTKIFIYLTILLAILLLLGGGVYSFMLGSSKNIESLKILSFCLFGFTILILVIVVILRKKINFTAALFTECCKGIQYNPGLLLIGLLVFVLLVAFISYWVAGFIFLFSIPEQTVQVQLPHTMPVFNTKLRNLLYFNFFGLLWTLSLLSGLFQVSIAGAMSTWYFAREYNDVKGSPSLTSFGHATTKSFGSIALGSLFVAVVEFINFLVQKLDKKNAITNNPVLKCVLCFVQCFLSCFQGLVKFINRYAYIYIAMHGDGFCASARNCMDLISRNSFSAVIVDILGDVVLFAGKLLGTVGSTIFSLFLLQVLGREISPVTIAMVIIIAFSVFSLFANIVGTGLDTMMVCYLEDLERNSGKKLNMEPSLHVKLQEKVRESSQ